MKKGILFVTFALAVLSFACGSATTKKEESKKVYKILSITDNYLDTHPDLMNNSLTQEKGAEEIQKIVIDSIASDISYLYEMPLEFDMSLKQSTNNNSNKYIIKFTITRYDRPKIESDKTIIVLQLFSIVTEDVVMKLKKNHKYNIKGKFEGSAYGKIELPSGNQIGGVPSISKSGSFANSPIVINLANLYVEDIIIDEYHSDKQ